ncbi:PREDICTED: uncharacterized protein LOC108569794 [Nicrophorus vespilloides]|uniref:Uncharacterized protein LOC108569794 n=1 Tax=Nicrophorus vespilloides TaxID=110193 RepID=A0ABM1NJH1_NICVS|nr:PREDICTED: uncharacterized protein LOC108569794 [Nicrophorus vespilloides]
MSPELNGNPPLLIQRKKNRDRKHSSTSKINDSNNPSYNYFHSNLNSKYHNVETYYPFHSYGRQQPEPMSLPIYPPPYYHMHPTMPYQNPVMKMPQAESNEYMSLPPVFGNPAEPQDQRRFSDPGLPNESDSSETSSDSLLIQKLTQQVSIMKDNNRKLNREVTELRMELNMLKQQQQHSRHFERDYEPGLITDIIREIRDAARIREDALLAKVKHIVEEKQLSMGQFHLTTEKSRNSERLSKLEEQMKSLNMNNSRSEDSLTFASPTMHDDTGSSARQVFELEKENLLLRRELQDARTKKEVSDQKILQLSSIHLRQKDLADMSDDGSKTTTESQSSSSMMSQHHTPSYQVVSGPVTDL